MSGSCRLVGSRDFCPIPGLNRTKTFHVKHFGPIGGQNLTRPLPKSGLVEVRLRGNDVSLAIGGMIMTEIATV